MIHIYAKFNIPIFSSLQIFDKIQTGVFLISEFLVNPFLKENCHNSRTSNDIYIKLTQVAKIDKRNTRTSKKFDHDLISAKCDIIVFLKVHGQFAVTRKPDSECIVYKTYIFINNIVLSY